MADSIPARRLPRRPQPLHGRAHGRRLHAGLDACIVQRGRRQLACAISCPGTAGAPRPRLQLTGGVRGGTPAAGLRTDLCAAFLSARPSHAAADGAMKSLDFGEIPSLLYFRPNSVLIMENLNASGACACSSCATGDRLPRLPACQPAAAAMQLCPSCQTCFTAAAGANEPACRACSGAGPADPQLGSWPVGINSTTVIQSMPFWPTIGADPGFTVSSAPGAEHAALEGSRGIATAGSMDQRRTSGRPCWKPVPHACLPVTDPLTLSLPPRAPRLQPRVYDCNFTLHATDLCTPEVYQLQFSALQQLAETSGTGQTDLYANGTVAYFDNWAAPVPVISAATKVASECRARRRRTLLRCCLLRASLARGPARRQGRLRLRAAHAGHLAAALCGSVLQSGPSSLQHGTCSCTARCHSRREARAPRRRRMHPTASLALRAAAAVAAAAAAAAAAPRAPVPAVTAPAAGTATAALVVAAAQVQQKEEVARLAGCGLW